MDKSILIVTTQTSMSEEEAKQKLETCDNDYMKVIRDHFQIEEKPSQAPRTLNQEIYSQIRKKISLHK